MPPSRKPALKNLSAAVKERDLATRKLAVHPERMTTRTLTGRTTPKPLNPDAFVEKVRAKSLKSVPPIAKGATKKKSAKSSAVGVSVREKAARDTTPTTTTQHVKVVNKRPPGKNGPPIDDDDEDDESHSEVDIERTNLQISRNAAIVKRSKVANIKIPVHPKVPKMAIIQESHSARGSKVVNQSKSTVAPPNLVHRPKEKEVDVGTKKRGKDHRKAKGDDAGSTHGGNNNSLMVNFLVSNEVIDKSTIYNSDNDDGDNDVNDDGNAGDNGENDVIDDGDAGNNIENEGSNNDEDSNEDGDSSRNESEAEDESGNDEGESGNDEGENDGNDEEDLDDDDEAVGSECQETGPLTIKQSAFGAALARIVERPPVPPHSSRRTSATNLKMVSESDSDSTIESECDEEKDARVRISSIPVRHLKRKASVSVKSTKRLKSRLRATKRQGSESAGPGSDSESDEPTMPAPNRAKSNRPATLRSYSGPLIKYTKSYFCLALVVNYAFPDAGRMDAFAAAAFVRAVAELYGPAPKGSVPHLTEEMSATVTSFHSKLRNKFKAAAQIYVPTEYFRGVPSEDCSSLITLALRRSNFCAIQFENVEQRIGLYENPCIEKVINQAFFKGEHSDGAKHYHTDFTPLMPVSAIALAITSIRFALDQHATDVPSNSKFTTTAYAKHYHRAVDDFNKWSNKSDTHRAKAQGIQVALSQSAAKSCGQTWNENGKESDIMDYD